MAEKISESKGFDDDTFDTYVPELEDAADIRNALELFYYGNSEDGNATGDVSLHATIVDFDTRIDANDALFTGHAGAISDVHGVGVGNLVVGTGTSQTLTNKTLTTPKINENVNLTATSTELNYVAGVTSNIQTQISNIVPTGVIIPFAGLTVPTGYFLCDGSSINNTTYSSLFSALTANKGTFSVTIATPAVFTLASHGLITGSQVYLTTTGTLPTGLNINTNYFVVRTGTNTFNLASTFANANASTPIVISTSGTQSGVHNLTHAPYGIASSTLFKLPNLNGKVPVGQDTATTNTAYSVNAKFLSSNVATLTTSAAHDFIVGDSVTVSGVDATFNGTYTVTATSSTTFSYSKVASNVNNGSGGSVIVSPVGSVIAINFPFDVLGETGGASKHRLLPGELAVHSHAGQIVFGIDQPGGGGGIDDTTIGNSQPNTGANSPPGGAVHNNLQPYIVVNYIIKH